MNSEQGEWFKKLHEKRLILSNSLTERAVAGLWNTVVDKYSSPAHYITELVQNADDAEATVVNIKLNSDGLLFSHNGTAHLTISNPEEEDVQNFIGDINAITSIGASSKTETRKIGKFGIGFKSVFSVTDRPHIQDDVFSFVIENYIVPNLAERVEYTNETGLTFFYLPFKKNIRQKAFVEAERRMENLNDLLFFLTNVRHVNCEIEGSNFEFNRVILSHRDFVIPDKFGVEHHFLKFSCSRNSEYYIHQFCYSGNKEEYKGCSVGFLADSNGKPCLIDEAIKNIYCFLPVELSGFFKSYVNAPYLLTENRERVKRNEQRNEDLNSLVFSIYIWSLYFLCLLSRSDEYNYDFDDLSNYLNDYIETDFFSQRFIGECGNVLNSKPVFVSALGKYVSSRKACFCCNEKIRSLINPNLLSKLVGEEGMEWCFCNLHDLRNYVDKLHFLKKHNLLRCEINAEHFAEIIKKIDFEIFSDDELKSIYLVIYEYKDSFADYRSILKNLKFIKCEDGVFRSPTDSDGNQSIFMSDDNKCNLHAPNDYFKTENDIIRLFRWLGIEKPGIREIIKNDILPKYQNCLVSVSDEETVANDLVLFSKEYSEVSYVKEQRISYLSLFNDIAFLLTEDTNGNVFFSDKKNVYQRSSDLMLFFKSNLDVRFLKQSVMNLVGFDKLDSVIMFLQAIGVSDCPSLDIISRSVSVEALNLQGNDVVVANSGTRKPNFEDKFFYGYDQFLDRITLESSVAFFNMLNKMVGQSGSYNFIGQISGKYTYYELRKRKKTEIVVEETTAYKQIFETKWLYTNDGLRVSPKEISTSDLLNEKYNITSEHNLFLLYLGIQYVEKTTDENEWNRKCVDLIENLIASGVTMDDLKDLVNHKLMIKKVDDK